MENDFKMKEYHGIVINLSQKDQSILNSINIIGKKKVILNFLLLKKISVNSDEIENVIIRLQNNMRKYYWPFVNGFYFHFYRNNELIIVFKDRIFRVTTDHSTWKEAIEYGLKSGIPKKQLDFYPCRIEDEKY